ncbi:polyprenol monophosphomannose synthase [Acidianus brierleyi]|uniref:Polyprenol monophosphomannose synthase n=1 Tax=Acidianus brierleyi TaxID=41673 RepID=A0A2U9IE66_9CREN|nr:polyprenol monophosphomannose synthase [Acidianus brierleyi]AWR94280.1 glycosyltransferase [Acidianus brierleyi]
MENVQKSQIVSIVIPTYNEKDNIINLIKRINSELNGNIIIVDDNSEDKTGEAVKSLGLENVKVFIRTDEKGLGSALRYGISKALEIGSSFIVTMDADFSHDPIYLKSMLDKARQGYDLVIGSRYIKGGRIENWSYKRKMISWGANLLVRLLLRSSLKDNTSNFRVYSRGASLQVLQCNTANGYEFQICAIYKILKSKMRVCEVPITFRDREKGQSKLSYSQILNWFAYVLKLYFSS